MAYQTELHEAESWRSMQEMMELAGELHEWESAYETGQSETAAPGRRVVRISTPMVVIRITLAPGKGRRIFPSSRFIADATTPVVRRNTKTGASVPPHVRIAAPVSTASGVKPKGVVFMPRTGSRQVNVVTNSATYAGRWLQQQQKRTPGLFQRVRRVQVLVDGKPCRVCAQRLYRRVRPLVPATANVNLRHVGRKIGQAVRTAVAPVRRMLRSRPAGIAIRKAAAALTKPGPKRLKTAAVATPKKRVATAPRPAIKVPKTTVSQPKKRPPAGSTPALAKRRAGGTAMVKTVRVSNRPPAGPSLLSKTLKEFGL